MSMFICCLMTKATTKTDSINKDNSFIVVFLMLCANISLFLDNNII